MNAPERLQSYERLTAAEVREFAVDVDRSARFPTESIAALRREKLLGCLVPVEYGGLGMQLREIASLCEVLGASCASTGLIFAMHQIQIACLARHALHNPYFQRVVRDIAEKQHLVASVTSEEGIGGAIHQSSAALDLQADHIVVEKRCPTTSYAAQADMLLLTCRRADDRPAHDQVLIALGPGTYELTQIQDWDTLGLRGTCSSGYLVSARATREAVLDEPFAEILTHTMHPISHLLWCSVWIGIAQDALRIAKSALVESKRGSQTIMRADFRLSDALLEFSAMQNSVRHMLDDFSEIHSPRVSRAGQPNRTVALNNLKIQCSESVVNIVRAAMLIVGIRGYRNDSPYSLGRHLRDSMGASLMVNNDRLSANNAAILPILTL